MENRHQGLEHYGKKLRCPYQELHLGSARSITAGDVPDALHHETVSARPNPRVVDTSDNMHVKEASWSNPSTTCVDFTHTDTDPFRISEE